MKLLYTILLIGLLIYMSGCTEKSQELFTQDTSDQTLLSNYQQKTVEGNNGKNVTMLQSEDWKAKISPCKGIVAADNSKKNFIIYMILHTGFEGSKPLPSAITPEIYIRDYFHYDYSNDLRLDNLSIINYEKMDIEKPETKYMKVSFGTTNRFEGIIVIKTSETVQLVGIFSREGMFDNNRAELSAIANSIKFDDGFFDCNKGRTVRKDTNKEANNEKFSITQDDIDIANNAVKMKGFTSQKKALPEDIAIYTLIKYSNDQGIIVPSSIVETEIENLKQYLNPTSTTKYIPWKESAIRRFWMDYSNHLYPQYGNTLVSFNDYLDTKLYYLLRAQNQAMEGFVASDEARWKATSSWKKYDSTIRDREEEANMERSAYQVLNDAEWAIRKSAEEISR